MAFVKDRHRGIPDGRFVASELPRKLITSRVRGFAITVGLKRRREQPAGALARVGTSVSRGEIRMPCALGHPLWESTHYWAPQWRQKLPRWPAGDEHHGFETEH